MTESRWNTFAEEMLEAVKKIERYTQNLTRESFKKNELVIDAVLRNLEIMGEAAKNVPVEVREQHPEIPWKRIIGLRNIVIHRYFGIDINIIWEIVTRNLPQTKPALVRLLENT